MKTRRGVTICRTGSFPLSSGLHTFTREQFESAVRNASGRTAPAIGIGHTDPRWATLDHDGEPALGRIENLRLSDDGEELVGDYVNMPGWFADALPSAYPRRSLEGVCNGDDLTVTGVKVLGTKMPAVHTLADLKEFVSDKGPVAVAAGADNNGHAFTVVLASQPDPREVTKVKPTVREALGLPASATNADVRAAAEAAGVLTAAAGQSPGPNQELVREMLGLAPDASDEEVKAKLKQKGLALSQLADMIDPEATSHYLQAAAAEGKFPAERIPAYQQMYERDPLGTRALIARMVAVDPKLLRAGAPDAEAKLRQSTRQALGLEPRESTHPLLGNAGPSRTVAASDAPAPQLTRTESGTVRWGGVPTRLSERHTRQVFHGTGWIDVDEARRMGITPADSALAIATTQRVGSAHARKALSEGLPARSALGVV